jgi:uncharacterized protein (TIGR02271 family)
MTNEHLDDELVAPLHVEELSVAKRVISKDRVQVSTVTRQHEELVDEFLAREHVEIERIPIGKPIDAMPPVREDGDTIVVPVVEETVVVERRLVLKEEVRIRKVRETERYQERVLLRKQEAVVARLPLEENAAVARTAGVEGSEIKTSEANKESTWHTKKS